MRKKLTKTIVITGATGDIASLLIAKIAKDLPETRLILLSRQLSALTEKFGHLPQAVLLENEAVTSHRIDLAAYDCDILINNAGFAVFKPFYQQTDQEIQQQMAVNFQFAVDCLKAFKPRQQVINIASIAGKLPSSKSSIYAASKAALLFFSDALRMEEPELIVTTVNTGPVKTKFHQGNQTYLQKVGRTALTPEQVASQIFKILGKNKRELNLPRSLALAAKLRALTPTLFDKISTRFFNFK